MSTYLISSLVDDLPLDDLKKVIQSIKDQYGLDFSITQVDEEAHPPK